MPSLLLVIHEVVLLGFCASVPLKILNEEKKKKHLDNHILFMEQNVEQPMKSVC